MIGCLHETRFNENNSVQERRKKSTLDSVKNSLYSTSSEWMQSLLLIDLVSTEECWFGRCPSRGRSFSSLRWSGLPHSLLQNTTTVTRAFQQLCSLGGLGQGLAWVVPFVGSLFVCTVDGSYKLVRKIGRTWPWIPRKISLEFLADSLQ